VKWQALARAGGRPAALAPMAPPGMAGRETVAELAWILRGLEPSGE
jgi:hypothetical protein